MNNNTHPCAGKCSEFKEGGQCFHCLINETPIQGVYLIHRTEHRIDHIVEPNDMGDDTHIENHISPLCKTESQPVSILESDNQIIERLKAENVAMQARIDELESENAILHQAAATHLRNQHHYYDLYHNLISQLYPYAVALEDDQMDWTLDDEHKTGRCPRYVDGYNRGRECAHFNLMEMMESDIEYIKAYCEVL